MRVRAPNTGQEMTVIVPRGMRAGGRFAVPLPSGPSRPLTEFIDGIGAGCKTGGADVTFAKALMKHFDDLDKSGEGDLSKQEVKAALTSFAKKDRAGKYPKLGELRALFDAFDLDGDGYVSYDELCEYIDEPPARAIPTK